MAIQRKSERRREPRAMLSGSLLILWMDDEGRERVCRARCLDISDSGVRLHVFDRLPSRATVMFNSYEVGIAGRGTVRFVRACKAAFEVGVECRSGTGWRSMFGRLRSDIRGFASEAPADPQ